VGVPRYKSLVTVIREVVREEVRHPIEPPRAATGSAPLRARRNPGIPGVGSVSARTGEGGIEGNGTRRSRPMTSVPIACGPVSG
jgi:hypothetical protein